MANVDDQVFMEDFGMEIPCWMLQAAPFLCLICIVWGIGRLSSRRDIQLYLWKPSRSRKEAMNQGFAKAVDSVAKQIKASSPSPAAIGSNSRRPVAPKTGKYKCVMRYQDIINRHDLSTVFQRTPPVAYIMNLEISSLSSDGCKLKGHRIDNNGNRWEIEESFVNNEGETYWVEKFSDTRILANGKFKDSKSFEGEWMGSDGFRGKYSEFTYVPPTLANNKLEVHTGVPLQSENTSLVIRLFQKIWPFSRSKPAIETAVPLPNV